MIPNDHALLLFRFGEKRWIEKLLHGELSFSCTGAFIYQAKSTGNDVQGDELEGIFACLDMNDETIEQMRKRFGRDLEEIVDGQYIMLRRRSSKLKPIFCFYGYTAGDALLDGDINHAGSNVIRHDFDKRMYSGFADSLKVRNVISDSHRFTQIIIQPRPFVDRIKTTMAIQGWGYTMRKVNYDLFKSKTFFIEPTNSYDELFYKFPEYAYQYETRICLKDKQFWNIFERISLNIGELPHDDYGMCHEEVYVEMNTNIQKIT